MARLDISKAGREFTEVVNRVANGKERAIVSLRDRDLDLEEARAALAEAKEKGTFPLEEARKRLGL